MDNNRLIKTATNCYYGSLTQHLTTSNTDYNNTFQCSYYPSTSSDISSSNDCKNPSCCYGDNNIKETSPVLFMDGYRSNSSRHSTCFIESSIENNISGSFIHEFRPSISRALDYCKNEVLPPYKKLLMLLGWHPFNIDCTSWNRLKVLMNLFHVVILILTICTGHILQYASCFRQDNLVSYDMFDWNIFLNKTNKIRPSDNSSFVYSIKKYNISRNQSFQFFNLSQIFYDLKFDLHEKEMIDFSSPFLFRCHDSGIFYYLVPSVIHLISFLIVLKHLRYCEVDRFHNICLLNQLLTTKIIGHKKACFKIKKAVRNWIIVIFSCLVWIMILMATRFFIINDVSFNFIKQSSSQQILILLKFFCFLLFTFIELVHISIIIIYALHCQMNIIFIQMNLIAIREKRIDFQEFAKNTEMFKVNINFLNNRYSLSVSLLMIYITTKAFATFVNIFTKYNYISWNILTLALSSMLYWLILLIIPLFQAARLTNACQLICDIGHELCARPFCYQQAAKDDLDSLLTYTSSLNLKVRLMMIPVQPSCIISIILVIILVILILSQLRMINT